MDVVLVNPGGRMRVYQSLGRDLAAIEPPVWAGMMAEFLRRSGLRVAIIDANADDLAPEEVAEGVRGLDPVLVAVVVYGHQPSASTQNMPAAGAIARAVKDLEPDRRVLLVGGHVAALPERTLREEACDYVAGGEGLFTILALAEALKSARPDLAKVPDLWFRDDGRVARTEPAPLLGDLDGRMPGLAWDLLPMDRYRAHNWHCFDGLEREPYAAIYTTLGCPYRCSFCCIQAPFRSGERAAGMKETANSYRYWSPETVVRQIDHLVERYGVRNVKIADEMFVLNTRHVGAICDLLIDRGHGLNIWAYARVDTVRDDASIEKMRRAGIRWLAFGIESASERVRGDVEKAFRQDEIYRTIERVRSAGIHVIGNYIFGLPEDDLDSMRRTLDLALDLNCEFANFYSAMAYPGSPLYDEALRRGWPLPETWAGYSQHAEETLPLPTKYLSAAEVLRFRDEAFHTYFESPRYLAMIDRTFGPAVVAHIKEMTGHRLKRLHA